ncbi:protein trachealess-like isoform X2 [Brevipalpus obovatus]|uniref:protein trachealess-like isoform X2 n=1 Tax=Brevipalpus obovatus TaxID=246614 RepID=UPI003D9DD5C2
MICPSYGPIPTGYGSAVQDHYHYHHHHHHQSVESAAQAAIVQSRILEMRKEKSRDAARSRRGKENHEFYELAKLLPLPSAITSQLDKASIIRLTISYLKLRDFALNGEPSWSLSNSFNQTNSLKATKLYNVFDVHQGTHILQALDGFAFALGQDGRFLYISETVSIYLGLSQVEMTGSSVFDYTHQQDHAELAEQLGISQSLSSPHLASSPLPPASVGSNATSESEGGGGGGGLSCGGGGGGGTMGGNFLPGSAVERQFCIRMKSTLTKRGCQHFKSSGYRVVHVISRLRPEMSSRSELIREPRKKGQLFKQSDLVIFFSYLKTDSGGGPPKLIGMVAVAIALPQPSQNEHRLEPDMFVMRLGLDFKILHCEPKIAELLDYSCDELTGRSFYSLIHGQDAIQVRKCHSDLIHKGQVMSRYFRIMNKNGGFTWIQTCATLICGNNGSSTSKAAGNSSSTPNVEEQEQSIITVNYIISGLEYESVIMDTSQLPGNNNAVSSSSSYLIPSASPASSSTTSMSKHTPISASPASPGLQSHLSGPPSTSQRGHDVENPSPSMSMDNSLHGHGSNAGAGGVNSLMNINGGNTANHSHNHSLKHAPDSPTMDNSGGHNQDSDCAKRRRFTSSPVRPWRTPSPPAVDLHSPSSTSMMGSSSRPLHGLSPSCSSSSSHSPSSSSPITTNHHHQPPPPPPHPSHLSHPSHPSHPHHHHQSNHLLRHISVIRETPPIVKPQILPPPYHHTHHPHPHTAHYHPLVDPYSAYFKDYTHLYKNGGNLPTPTAPSTNPVAGPPHHHHHHHPWGAYN